MAILNFKAKFGVQVTDSQNPSGFDLLPIGSLMYWAGPTSSIPPGWLLCDGSAVSRTTYANLDAVFAISAPNYPYGNGDGSTTFNLPDCRGRALSQEAFTPTNTNKQLSGSESYTLVDANIVSHSHAVNNHSHDGINSHTHPGTSHTHSNGSHTHSGGHTHPSASSGGHTHAIYSVNTSSSGSGPLRSSGPSGTPVTTTFVSELFPHSHQGNATSATSGSAQGLLGITVNTSTLTSAGASSNTGTASSATSFNGSSPRGSFSLMQPFVVLNVIIKA